MLNRRASVSLAGYLLLCASCDLGGYEDPHAYSRGEPAPNDHFDGDAGLRRKVVSSTKALPPITGGGLEIDRTGRVIIASDPDHDSVWILGRSFNDEDDAVGGGAFGKIDTESKTIVDLEPGSQPGRIAQLSERLMGIVLEKSAQIALIDIETHTPSGSIQTCPSPRGLAKAPAGDSLPDETLLWVACADGRLQEHRLSDGSMTRAKLLEPGLRDVVFDKHLAYVSLFRSASVLVLDSDMNLSHSVAPPVAEGSVANSAWRLRSSGEGGGAVMVHQIAQPTVGTATSNLSISYGVQRCAKRPVQSAMTYFENGAVVHSRTLDVPALAVDVARLGDRRYVVSAGQAGFRGASLNAFTLTPLTGQNNITQRCESPESSRFVFGPRQVAIATHGRITVVQSRSPWRLEVWESTEPSADSTTHSFYTNHGVLDTGQELFHSDTGTGIACASCHPGGGDDGITWEFVSGEKRRTQDLRGGLLDTAPFHWEGEHASIADLMNETFTERMGGHAIQEDEAVALGRWLEKLPMPVAPTFLQSEQTLERIEQGRELFEEVGCASCHNRDGAPTTASFDVGTGGAFQVPRLVGIAKRGPFMHDGCAETLLARFTDTRCGGGDQHGKTSQLSAGELEALVAYLGSL